MRSSTEPCEAFSASNASSASKQCWVPRPFLKPHYLSKELREKKMYVLSMQAPFKN